MAANTLDNGENAPFIVPDEKLYAQEVAEMADLRLRIEHLDQAIKADEAAVAGGERDFTNPAFNNAAASTDSVATSINNLTLHEKKELRADLDLRLSQLMVIISQDRKNPVVLEEMNQMRELEMQRREDDLLDHQYHRGIKWTIGIAIGFGFMCIMIPATALLLVQKGVI